MKKIICLMFVLIFLLCACDNTVFENGDETIGFENIGNNDSDIIDTGRSFDLRGTWLSYLEIKPKSFDVSKKEYENYIDMIFQNLEKAKINNIFVQVRPFADAIYPSEFFPTSAYVVKNQGDKLPFDFFEVIIERAKEHNIFVHAWINPFRIQKEFDETKLCKTSVYSKWLSEKGNTNILKANGGLYFNPASTEVHQLILQGVRELLENYDIEGIHIDDYFYPTKEEAFDKTSFEKYKKSGGKLSLEDWRRENINSIVSGIYNAVKSFGNDKIFSISPGGDILKNRNEMFADCEKWCSESGFCDIIIPQIYYGFDNEKMPFESCVKKWKSIVCPEVKIAPGLALYKSGKEDHFAGVSAKGEWQENDDIIKRQVALLKESGFDGFCLYSAGFVNFIENSYAKQMQNLLDVL